MTTTNKWEIGIVTGNCAECFHWKFDDYDEISRNFHIISIVLLILQPVFFSFLFLLLLKAGHPFFGFFLHFCFVLFIFLILNLFCFWSSFFSDWNIMIILTDWSNIGIKYPEKNREIIPSTLYSFFLLSFFHIYLLNNCVHYDWGKILVCVINNFFLLFLSSFFQWLHVCVCRFYCKFEFFCWQFFLFLSFWFVSPKQKKIDVNFFFPQRLP